MIKLSDKTKKTLNIIGGIFSYILIGFTVVIMLITIITIAPSNRNESEKFLFGYKFYIVTSDSMSKTDFDAGDLICVKKIDPDNLEVGDIISYVSEYAGNYGSIVTHKIREKNEISEGEYQFITYGTTTNMNDILPISESQVLGKYVYSFPKVGKIFIFMKTIPGYIFLILFPFLILIGYLGYCWIKIYKQYKKELNNMKEEDIDNEN